MNILSTPAATHPVHNSSTRWVPGGPENGRVRSPLAGAGDNCPSCDATLAPDQRYCLHCGQRRGDPRLPFMDAVAFMDAAKQPPQPAAAPPPAPDRRPLLSANASLVAGVATLVLAIGVGVLIGRSGDHGGNVAAQPQIITVGGGGGGEVETGGAAKESKGTQGAAKSGGGKANTATKKKAKEKTEVTASGASKATEEAYPVNPDVNLAKPEQKLGGECDPSEAGCGKNGKFEGTFFE